MSVCVLGETVYMSETFVRLCSDFDCIKDVVWQTSFVPYSPPPTPLHPSPPSHPHPSPMADGAPEASQDSSAPLLPPPGGRHAREHGHQEGKEDKEKGWCDDHDACLTWCAWLLLYEYMYIVHVHVCPTCLCTCTCMWTYVHVIMWLN